MLFIPGVLIALFTFPGVIVHEIAHRFFAELTGVPVYAVRYFQFGNPSGYVIHGKSQNLMQAFFISVGPLIINTILCAAITIAAIYPWIIFEAQLTTQECILLWLGISIGMHAFPSNHDIEAFTEVVNQNCGKGLMLAFAKLVEVIFRIANALRFFWFDVFYAVGVAFIIPLILRAT